MTSDNQADAGKSRRGPGRRFSRSGWRPLLFRVSRYFKDSTGGAAGKGFAEEIFKTVSPVVSPEVEFGCFMWLVLLLLLVAQVLLSRYK